MDLLSGLMLLLLAALLIGWASGRREIRQLRMEIAHLAALPGKMEIIARNEEPSTMIDPTPIPNAGGALANPPANLDASLAFIRSTYKPGRYTVPLGWTLLNNQPACVGASFLGDTNHILITGRSDSGKDNAAMGMLLSLALTYPPERVQIAIIDGKGGLDWAKWITKRHVSQLAMDVKDIGPAMEALRAERERRTIKLRGVVSKWDEYAGDDLPLVVVYVAELSLLQSAIGKTALGDWLTTELVSSRAVGIRYIIASQDVSNLDTTWRRQISLFMAGVQNTQSADMPNTGMYTKDLEALGAVPPSQLPSGRAGSGVFTCIHDRDVATLRTTLLTDANRTQLLGRLPDKPLQSKVAQTLPMVQKSLKEEEYNPVLAALLSGQPLPFSDEPVGSPTERPIGLSNGKIGDSVGLVGVRQSDNEMSATNGSAVSYVELPLPEETVPYEEQRRIIETARTVKSKRQLALALYGVDGGQKYQWVKMTCEATGIL
jgi:DNA segregation ATPase FtsK/SpoIIIE, S-DNA-T family